MQEELRNSPNGNVAFGVNCIQLGTCLRLHIESRLTDEGLLAEILGFLVVMLPLEDSKSLVDQREDIDTHGLVPLLHFHSLVEFLDCLREVLLVKEELAVVVIDIRNVLKVLHGPLKGGHRGRHGTHLVLRHTKLDVGENEAAVKFDRLLVVLGSIRKLPKNEVKLRAMIVNIGIILVVRNREIKIVRRRILVSYTVLGCGRRTYL